MAIKGPLSLASRSSTHDGNNKIRLLLHPGINSKGECAPLVRDYNEGERDRFDNCRVLAWFNDRSLKMLRFRVLTRRLWLQPRAVSCLCEDQAGCLVQRAWTCYFSFPKRVRKPRSRSWASHLGPICKSNILQLTIIDALIIHRIGHPTISGAPLLCNVILVRHKGGPYSLLQSCGQWLDGLGGVIVII